MITELFINSCILITFISVFYTFILNKNTYLSTSRFFKVLVGFWSGLLGILLMLFSVPINQNVIVDFRYVPIIIAAIFGGILSPIMASIIIGVFSILYLGITKASIVALIDVFLIGIGCSIISSTKALRKIKWIHSIVYLNIVTSISMIIVIKDSRLLFTSLSVYPIAIILMAYFVFKYTEYLSKSVKIHRILKRQATVDSLTGLNNVRQFKKDLNNFSQRAIRKGKKLSLLYLDIDYFKKVNDTYGHSSGDRVLRNLAIILRRTCRSFDIISRNGGEEFSVLLLDCSGSNAFRIAERIRKNVEENKFYISDKYIINLTISIGISTYSDITDNIDNLFKNADNALYEAKITGRNKICIHDLNKQIIDIGM